MRAIKIISTMLLALLAVTAGLFVAAVVAVSALAVYLAARLLGYKGLQAMRPNLRRPTPPGKTRPAGDAIDVTATEVAAEPTRSLPSGSKPENAHFTA